MEEGGFTLEDILESERQQQQADQVLENNLVGEYVRRCEKHGARCVSYMLGVGHYTGRGRVRARVPREPEERQGIWEVSQDRSAASAWVRHLFGHRCPEAADSLPRCSSGPEEAPDAGRQPAGPRAPHSRRLA